MMLQQLGSNLRQRLL